MASQKTAGIATMLAPTLLTMLFVTLKAFDQIDWDWMWCFAPFWIPMAFMCMLVMLVASFAFVGAFVRTMSQ